MAYRYEIGRLRILFDNMLRYILLMCVRIVLTVEFMLNINDQMVYR
jgi:hypothetical protein